MTPRIAILTLLCLAELHAQSAEPFDYPALLQSIRVPQGFAVTLAAGEPEVRFPMFAALDADGRLVVAESSGNDLYAGLRNLTRDCRVSRLEDSDGDGRFESASVFASGVTFPMGLAWRNNRLYLADPPNLVALTDTDGDGRADWREVILTGFGHTDNGSLHGVTFGPDDRLYFTMGEPDGWKLPRGDGTFLEGSAGALFRCRPDGSQLEVVSRGFVNLVEIEFLPGGEMVGTDNWFQRPADGLRDALVDCALGGQYPYAADRGTPLPRTGILMPPVVLLPAVAHSGLTRLRRTGFPPDWREGLFVAEHNTRKVTRSRLRRHGSTFTAIPSDFASADHPDFHPSDVLEAPDGSLLIVDTGGWYVEHCPTGRIRDSRAPGGIYRVRWIQAGDAGPGPGEARLTALWRLDTRDLVARLGDPDPTVVCAALRAIASKGAKSAAAPIAALLDSPEASVRRAAAEALAVCGSSGDAPRLASALAVAADDFERHACIAALLAVAEEPFVRSLNHHESPRVRTAALHLLDQPPFGTLRFADLIEPLGASDPGFSLAARQLLGRHRDWARDALPYLRRQLAPGNPGQEPGDSVSELLVAFQSETGVRSLISAHLDPDSDAPDRTRSFLLSLLPRLNSQPPEAGWLRGIPAALENAALRPAALAAAMAYPRAAFDPTLEAVAGDAGIPDAERLAAARAVSQAGPPGERVFALALESLDAKAGGTERALAVDWLSNARLASGQLPRLIEAIGNRGAVSPDPLVPALARAANDTTRPMLEEFFHRHLRSGWTPDRGTLNRAIAIFPAGSTAPASLLGAWERNRAARPERLREFQPLLTGGDPDRGREGFDAATCAGCHRIGQRGGTTGPDLTRIGAIRSGTDLLESILFPSSTFAQGYEPHLLVRRNGEELFGSLVSRTSDGAILRDGAGVLHHMPQREIASLTRQELSAMPSGLEQMLTRDQFRDLLAYLMSLR